MYKDPKTRYTLRVDDVLLAKAHVVAKSEHRSLNQQLEMILAQMVASYEQENGTIEVEEE